MINEDIVADAGNNIGQISSYAVVAIVESAIARTSVIPPNFCTALSRDMRCLRCSIICTAFKTVPVPSELEI
jgi:hypothetical protein